MGSGVREDEGMETVPTPMLVQIKNGWLARGDGWAVRGDTPEEATQTFEAHRRWHADIDARPPRPPVEEELDAVS